jgi:cell division septation protein DedD
MAAERGEKGLSAGVLAAVFLVWVGVSAVFFSLGFLVGHNQQSSKAEPVAERVTGPSMVPPVVGGPSGVSRARAKEPATDASAATSTELSVPLKPKPPRERGVELESHAKDSPSESSKGSATPATSQEVRMGFTVQVDALRAKQDAEVLVRILKARHYPVFLVTPQYSNASDNLYRVQVGPFTSREDAEKVRTKLTQEGFKPFIRR